MEAVAPAIVVGRGAFKCRAGLSRGQSGIMRGLEQVIEASGRFGCLDMGIAIV